MTDTQEQSTAVAVFETATLLPAVIFAEGGASTVIDKMRDFIKSVDADISTPAGRETIKSTSYKIKRTKTALDSLGKDLKSAEQKKVDAIDAERKRIRDEFDIIDEEFRKPLDEWNNREAKRVMVHEAALKALERQEGWYEMPDPTAEQIRERITQVAALALDNWEEFTARATQTKENVLRALGQRLTVREKFEVDQAELARLRAAEEERKRIAHDEEVAAKAKKDAEDKAALESARVAEENAAALKAEQDRVEAVERKAADDAAAAAKALQDAETKRIADLKAADEKAQAEKTAALKKQQDDAAAALAAELEATRKREADVAHRTSRKTAAKEALMKHCAVDEVAAIAIVTAIVKGEIPNVAISY